MDFLVCKSNMARKMKIPMWVWIALAVVLIAVVMAKMVVPTVMVPKCPGSQVYCPGVGCLSGQDKCFPGSKGGPSSMFSKEGFVSKTCPDGTRLDGPCLMDQESPPHPTF